MKNLKMLYIALIALVAGVLGACTTNGFEPGPQASGPQVSFLATNPTLIEFTGAEGEETQRITLSRLDTTNDLSVYILADMPKEDQPLFSIPEFVEFKAGEATTELVMTVDHAKFQNDKTYTVGLYIDETVTTPYGCAEWKVNFALNPWDLMKDSKNNNAKGKFRGLGFIDALDVDTSIEVDVDIYKHKSLDGIYKIANPWQMSLAIDLGFSSLKEAEAAGLGVLNDLIIDASNPSAVIVAEQEIGIDIGMGPMFVFTGYPDYLAAAAGAGTLVDGVITFPTKGTFAYFPEYNAESIYYGNSSGMIRIVLPGVEIADYSLAVAYDGMDVAADNKTVSAKLKFLYGDDVTGIKYIVVPGNISKNYAEALQALVDGTAENILEIADFVKGGDSANVKYGMTEQGEYTVVAVPADKDGALRAKEAIATAFFFQGLGPVEEHPCEISVDLNKLSVYLPKFSSQYPDTHNVSFLIKGKDIVEAKSFMASTSAIEGVLAQGATIEQIVEANADDISAEYLADINGEGFSDGYINLSPDTSYTMIVWAKNKYGETTIVQDTHVTDAVPEYTGELVIGDYLMTCTIGAGTENESTSNNLFAVLPDGESGTDFIVSNFGTNRVNGLAPQFKAVYDSAAGTLTLSGEEKGYEQYGSAFAVDYGYLNKEETLALQFLSMATNESTSGADPVVLTVDPVTKQITGMQNYAFAVVVFDKTISQVVQYIDYFAGQLTTVVPYSSAATASVKKASFGNANSNNFVVSKQLRGLKVAKFTTSPNSSKKLGVSTVKPTFVENYTPEKVKGISIVKANAEAFRR